MKKYIGSALLILGIILGACATLGPSGKVAVEQHASDLLMCQEEGRAASKECLLDASSDGGAICDQEAMLTYEACKKGKGL